MDQSSKSATSLSFLSTQKIHGVDPKTREAEYKILAWRAQAYVMAIEEPIVQLSDVAVILIVPDTR